MSTTRAQIRKTGRIAVLSTALSLAMAGGVASTASATSSNGSPSQPQSISRADSNHGGANGQCPGGAYCSTRHGEASMNGNGKGKAAGRPAAGAVGKADNKNPKGQRPNGSDHNNGYECDGNHGIARGNPAHTACTKPPVVKPPCDKPPVEVPPVVTPPAVTPPAVVTPVVAGVGASAPMVELPVVVSPAEAAVSPLPTAAAAGQADNSGQLVAGGFAAFAALLAMGAGFLRRRRQSEI